MQYGGGMQYGSMLGGAPPTPPPPTPTPSMYRGGVSEKAAARSALRTVQRRRWWYSREWKRRGGKGERASEAALLVTGVRACARRGDAAARVPGVRHTAVREQLHHPWHTTASELLRCREPRRPPGPRQPRGEAIDRLL